MIDTHCHLNDEKLVNNVENILNDCKQKNINKMICVGYDLQSSCVAVDLANKHESIYACIGVHPHDSQYYNDQIEDKLVELATHKKVVGFGEIGLDYYYKLSQKNIQKEVFERQLILANKLKLPVVIHTREAIADTLEIIKSNINYINNGLVVHCYNASYETTKQLLNYGFKFSFGGPITYKNSKLPELIKKLPADSYFLETDSPYLAPQQLRGQVNVPQNVRFVAEKIAEILKIKTEEVERFTDLNAELFFKF